MSGHTLVARVAVAAAVYSIDRPYDYSVPAAWQETVQEGQRVIVPFGAGNRKTEGIILELVEADNSRQLKGIVHLFDDEVVLQPQQKALALWMCRRYFCTFFQAANVLFPPGVWNRKAETYAPPELPKEEAFEGISGRKKRILEAIYAAEKPLTAGELSKLLQPEDIKKDLAQLVKTGRLTVQQQFQQNVREKKIAMLQLAMPLEQALDQIGKGSLRQKRESVLQVIHQAGQLPEKEVCYLTGVGTALIRRLVTLGILISQPVQVSRMPRLSKRETPDPVVLNDCQQTAFERLIQLQSTGQPEAALLYGVTGSGKTQVYIRLIQHTLEQGKNAILLVPEIALTPQMLKKFQLYFREQVAVMHSGLTAAQRYDEYCRIQRGDARVVIGTRTAVFAPLNNLGCIIIDEEQEPTYKSESDPRYHAREVAKYRAAQEKCLLLLGSATPSVESYHAAQSGTYHLLSLPQRYQNVPLPSTLLADMRGQLREGDPSRISRQLLEELQLNLSRGEQSILFINRRGSARMAACVDCGHIPTCENCSVALTYHSRNGRLMCHHCGYSIPMIDTCPACGGQHLRLIGSGTQSMEEELQTLLPEARILRMDADTTEGRVSHEKLLDSFAKGKADILLGTQMVAKGLDFDNVTLVGVLDADLSLYCGDYHATERTFSLLAQVVGRAGRRDKPGRAVIQTYTPQHPVISAAAEQDYDAFYRQEILTRQALKAPPFANQFVFRFGGTEEHAVQQAAQAFAQALATQLPQVPDVEPHVLGPAPAPIAKLNKRYFYTVSFRGRATNQSRALVSRMLAAYDRWPGSRNLTVSADIDPYYI